MTYRLTPFGPFPLSRTLPLSAQESERVPPFETNGLIPPGEKANPLLSFFFTHSTLSDATVNSSRSYRKSKFQSIAIVNLFKEILKKYVPGGMTRKNRIPTLDQILMIEQKILCVLPDPIRDRFFWSVLLLFFLDICFFCYI
jgi:hypothetical protein